MLWGKNSFSHLREVSSWILWSFVTKVLKLQNLKYHMLCVFHVLNFKRGEKSREGNQSVTTLMGSSEFNMRSLRRGIRAEAFKLNNIVWTLIIVKIKKHLLNTHYASGTLDEDIREQCPKPSFFHAYYSRNNEGCREWEYTQEASSIVQWEFRKSRVSWKKWNLSWAFFKERFT